MVDTAALGNNGFVIEGADAGGNTGYSVDGLPDLNGDCRPEVIVGAYDAAPTGRAYIVFGRSQPGSVSLATLTQHQGLVLEGLAEDDRFGRSVTDLGCFFGGWRAAIAIGADSASPLERESAGQEELFADRFSNPECGDKDDWRDDDRWDHCGRWDRDGRWDHRDHRRR